MSYRCNTKIPTHKPASSHINCKKRITVGIICMSSKTKIVVLNVKELIYTGIFAALGILFIILLIIMFLPKEKKQETMSTVTQPVNDTYVPGVYTTSLILNDNVVEIEVTVDEENINSIRLVNLDEAVTTMYPLIQPSFEDLADQIITNQSLEGVTYPDDSKYTSMILLDAITSSLNKALENQGETDSE